MCSDTILAGHPGNTTTGIGLINLWTETRPMKLVVFTSRHTQNSVIIHGYHTAMDLCRYQLSHEQEFATNTLLETGSRCGCCGKFSGAERYLRMGQYGCLESGRSRRFGGCHHRTSEIPHERRLVYFVGNACSGLSGQGCLG